MGGYLTLSYAEVHLSLCLINSLQHGYVEVVGVRLYTLLTLALDGDKCLPSGLASFVQRKDPPPPTVRMARRLDGGEGWSERLGERQNICLSRETIPSAPGLSILSQV